MNATNNEMGAWFSKDKGGKYSNLCANGEKPNVKGRTHQTLNHPFFLVCPIIYFFQKFIELVNARRWEEYGNQFRIWEATHFWKMCFWLMRQLNAQKYFPTHMAFTSSSSSCFWSSYVFPIHVLAFFFIFTMDGKSIWKCSVTGLFPWNFCCCFLITQLGKHVFGCIANGRRDPLFLGVCWGHFSHMKPVNIPGNRVSITGLFYPSTIFRFWLPRFFSSNPELVFCVWESCVLVWTGLEWKREELAWWT